MTEVSLSSAANAKAVAQGIRDERQRRERRRGFAKHVLLIAASFLMIYPLLWMMASSLKPDSEIFGSLSIFPTDPDWANYVEGWDALVVSFTSFYINSGIVVILSVIGNVMASAFVAYAFARLDFRFKRLWFTLMMATLMVPHHIVLIPQYLLFLNLGWVNTFLPLIVPKFLATDGFFIFLMVQFFRQLPRELDEAAMIDGCSPFKIFWAIILPLSLPAMATAAIFSFIWSWQDFLAPLVYLNDVRDYTVPLALRMFLSQDSTSLYGPMFAMSILSIVPIVLFFVVFQRFIIRGIAMSGLK